MLSKRILAMSLSRIRATTWRCWWSPPLRAAVMHFSATGRRALALASVVTSDSAAIREATRLPSMAFWWAAPPPSRRPRFGVPCTALVLRAQGQPALVETLDDLVERLLAEVGDAEQVVVGPLDELPDGVDLRPLEAVPGP